MIFLKWEKNLKKPKHFTNIKTLKFKAYHSVFSFQDCFYTILTSSSIDYNNMPLCLYFQTSTFSRIQITQGKQKCKIKYKTKNEKKEGNLGVEGKE